MKSKFTILVFLLALILLRSVTAVHAQSMRDIIKTKKEQLKKKKDQVVKDILGDSKDSASGNTQTTSTPTTTVDHGANNPVETETASATGRPKLSEISEADFSQNTAIPIKDKNGTRMRIAENFFIDMKGKYPAGYFPKWRFISYPSNLSVTKENWISPTSQVAYTTRSLEIGEYGNKAVIRERMVPDCECFADIIIKNGVAVLTSQPQTFDISGFSKILNERSTGEACMTSYNNARDKNGGYEGKVTLSANENGDITMDYTMEYYSAGWKDYKFNTTTKKREEVVHPKQVSYRYTAKNIIIENEMSPAKANDIVKKEQEAKQKQKDYIAKMTKQSDSLQKVIASKYPGAECRSCFVRNSNSSLQVTPTKTAYKFSDGDVYMESGTDWDVNTKLSIKNGCSYPLTFIGIQQFHDEQNGYYLKDVIKTMEVGYNFGSEQGLMSSVFTSLIGGGSEFNFALQEKYVINYAYAGAIQWLKVVKGK